MATFTPPPYFPQQISAPDEKRYRKFKIIVGAVIAALLLALVGAVVGIVYLVKAML
jgi:hypothetical protein